jgi:hypothetical protein
MHNSIEIIKWTIGGSLATIVIFLLFIRHVLTLYTKKYDEFETKLNLKNLEKEKSVLKTRIDVQEETIQKVSKELHDNVNQLLTLAKLNLNNTKLKESDLEKITISKDLITEAINELTNMSNSLSSNSIQENGLIRTLEQESERIMKINNTKICLKINQDSIKLDSEEQLVLYRIFQEATRNAIIHGNAKQIDLFLYEDKIYLFNFTIIDNGIGFNQYENKYSDSRSHQGIKNMIKRANTINAECKIESSINFGTTIKIFKYKT